MSTRSLWLKLILAAIVAFVTLVMWELRGPRQPDIRQPAFTLSATPSTDADANSHDPVTRGRYLALAGDCVACHTAPGGKPFAGGLNLETAFGTIVASNITPDKATGIGDWSTQDFLHAVRDGVGRHGKNLYPAMPYNDYAKVSDQDLLDIKAYLDTIPPVNNTVAANQLPFPFNIRQMMWGWNLLFFSNSRYEVDASQSAQWNRGAYLVDGLGHCTACHTPKNIIGGDKSGQPLQGYTLQGWYAPELSGNDYLGLGKWSVPHVVEYLKSGSNVHSVASGPMAEAVSNSTQHLNDADLTAIAVYLKSLSGSGTKAPAALPETDPRMQLGHKVYADNCAACHISSGAGVTGMVSSFAGASVVQAQDPVSLIRTVLLGSRGAITQSNPTGAAMPNFSWKLSDKQAAAALTYIRNSWGNAASVVTAEEVSNARAELKAHTPLKSAVSAQ